MSTTVYVVAESFFRDPVLTAAFGWNITEEIITIMANFPDSFQPV